MARTQAADYEERKEAIPREIDDVAAFEFDQRDCAAQHGLDQIECVLGSEFFSQRCGVDEIHHHGGDPAHFAGDVLCQVAVAPMSVRTCHASGEKSSRLKTW